MYHVNADDLPGNDVSRTFEGGKHGPSSVSFFLVHNRPGDGPNLHQHPYDETFVILEGHVVVRVGDEHRGRTWRYRHRPGRHSARLHQPRTGPGPTRVHPRRSNDEDRVAGLNPTPP